MGIRPICFTFSDFSDTTGLMLNGDAETAISGGQTILRLTRDTTTQAGSTFTTNTFPISNGFSTFFSFQKTNPGGIQEEDGTGADGIVFIVQNNSNTAVGINGGGLGYRGITNSIGVEFDSWWNNESPDDINGNHIGINLDGSTNSVISVPVLPRLNNGDTWYAWIDYNSTTQRLEVRLSQNNVRPTEPTLAYTVDLPDVLGSNEGFVGFSAATFGAFQNHDILYWEFCTGTL